MKSIFLFFLVLFNYLTAFCQEKYWQQETNYTIDVRLDDTQHSLDGFLKLEYINHSPDTISFIWFHLWPNAFKNDHTAFSEQQLQNGRTDFYFSRKEEKGYINRLDFRTNNITLKSEDHPLYIDVVKVFLSQPLASGESVEITTPFHEQLPRNFSRGGHTGKSYQVTQWYPKPAVYDRKGWHPMPYLEQGEFYSEFGSFDVRITVPTTYVVAATGELQNEDFHATVEEQPVISEINKVEKKKTSLKKKSVVKKSSLRRPLPNKSLTEKPSTITNPGTRMQETKTLQYKQDNIHDFAWFADKKFIVMKDTLQLESGKIIKVYSYYTSLERKVWNNSIQFIKDAVRFRSMNLGEYPYNTVSVVEAKMGFEGGMEYPTITSISPTDNEVFLEETIQHEVGHNWFYGIIGSNERDHPWMDEGVNTYYDRRYEEWKYGGTQKYQATQKLANLEQVLVNAYSKQKLDQPINTHSADFTAVNYLLIAYSKAATWMKELERVVGKQTFDSAMQEYHRQWQFRHPYPEDFQKHFENFSRKDLSLHFKQLDVSGPPASSKRKLKPAFLYSLKSTDKFTYINMLPAAGFNKYDGFMLGAVIHNFNLPPNSFRFIVVPLYATGSKMVNGIGAVNYSFFPDKHFQRIELGVSGARFSSLKGVDSSFNKIFGGFTKIVPSLRFTFKNSSARSTLEKWIEWKTYFIGERGFNYVKKSTDSIFYPTEARVQNRYLNQLTFNITDYRALYPYDVQLQLQQGAGFYRANATANYFYNYANGGGAQVRFFAAKFGYIGSRTTSKEFETSVYHPKLTAIRGSEDYTYSNYFMGRNEAEYFLGQQIMLRDGGLKLRTDLFQDLQGRSDNWVSSINLNTTLPKGLFPVKLPVRIFLDVGTYAEAWKKEAATSRFLYVGGLQLSLFKNLLNIYAPLVYSREFRDNLKSVPGENKFFQRLSFSIDIHRFDLRRIVGYKVPY